MLGKVRYQSFHCITTPEEWDLSPQAQLCKKTTPGELTASLPWRFLCPKNAYFIPPSRPGSDETTGGLGLIWVDASEDLYSYDENRKCGM